MKPRDPRESDTTSAPIQVDALLAGRRVIKLVFRGEIYRLTVTRNEKLILTK
ncbi:MAG: hemin uptake protein HemP [Woeseiaceae bacterium]